ncbi:MAG: multiheme c-type cytochrome [Acidobacteriota bacterium]
MQTDALIEGMNALDYRVVNLSPTELRHGYGVLRERMEEARFEFISANLVWQDTGEPLVAPTAVREVRLREGAEVQRARLGFIGLTKSDPAFMAEGPEGRRIVTADPFVAAAKYVPRLMAEADVVIALVSLDLDGARRLPGKVRGLDLVLGGYGPARTRDDDFPEDTRFGNTRIFYVGHQGQHLGEVRMVFGPDGHLASSRRATIRLTREWPEDPVLAQLMESTKVAVNEYNKARAEAAGPFRAASGEAGGAPATRPSATGPGYTGSGRCAECHRQEYSIWSRSGHARAFDVLVRESQDFNPKCVRCHTIGFGRPQGFVNARATPHLVHVGCESCHGPSQGHPEERAEEYGRTDTAACVTCHTKDNSPDYDPATYIPRVRHWSDERVSR